MSSGFHRYLDWLEIAEALIYARWVGSETATVDDVAIFVDGTVMAPDVSKVDTDRRPDLGTMRGLFEMKYCGCLFMRIVSLVSEVTFSSHFSVNSLLDVHCVGKLPQSGLWRS
jgi:hypothetical protein